MSFSFPMNLSTEEIIQCLQDLQVHIDAAFLTKPVPEQVKLCYEQAVLALMGVSREELTQPKFELLPIFEYPELHDDSVPLKNFFNYITKLMLTCGVRDFTLNDIYKPEPVRLRRTLCALINFARFREEKLDMLNELEAEQAEEAAQEQALIAELEKQHAEIKRLKEQRAARQAEVAPIQAETEAIAAHISQYNKAHSVLEKEVRALKAQANTLTDQASEAKLTLASIENEISQLEDEIVQSPDKHRQAVAELVTATEAQRAYYARLCTQSDDQDRKIEMIGKFERDVQRCIKQLEDLDAAVARKKEVNKMVKATREDIVKTEQQYTELEASKQTAKRQVQALSEKMARQDHQNKLKLDAIASKVEEQQKAREAAQAKLAAADARAAEVEAQVRGWRERASEVTNTKDARVRALRDKYAMLRRAVGEYNRQLEELMSKPLPGPWVSSGPVDMDYDVRVSSRDAGSLSGEGCPSYSRSSGTVAARLYERHV